VLIVALPCRFLDVSSAPRCFVSILTVRLVAFQFLTSLAAGVRVAVVIAVRLAALLAPLWILVPVFASCTIADSLHYTANYDTTSKAYITIAIAIRLRYDYDTTIP